MLKTEETEKLLDLLTSLVRSIKNNPFMQTNEPLKNGMSVVSYILSITEPEEDEADTSPNTKQ